MADLQYETGLVDVVQKLPALDRPRSTNAISLLFRLRVAIILFVIIAPAGATGAYFQTPGMRALLGLLRLQ